MLAGQAMTLDQAVDEALAWLSEPVADAESVPQPPGGRDHEPGRATTHYAKRCRNLSLWQRCDSAVVDTTGA